MDSVNLNLVLFSLANIHNCDLGSVDDKLCKNKVAILFTKLELLKHSLE